MYRVWLQAECIAGALSMLSMHSPDHEYSDHVFMVLVSIFIRKPIITFRAQSQCYKCVYTSIYIYSKNDGVPLLAHVHCK